MDTASLVHQLAIPASPPPSRGSTHTRRESRRPLGPANILTVTEAIAELGLRADDARRWLDERGLIRFIAGRRRVVAGDLADAVRGASADQEAAPVPATRLRRRKL